MQDVHTQARHHWQGAAVVCTCEDFLDRVDLFVLDIGVCNKNDPNALTVGNDAPPLWAGITHPRSPGLASRWLKCDPPASPPPTVWFHKKSLHA
jgi:hypothetical protein